jgi:CubicO group peptidase (beta-lactamase class C family)
MWHRLGSGVVILAGAVAAFVTGLFVYMNATATPIHVDPAGVPSVARAASPPVWGNAVAQGRQMVRAGLTAQNLPGVSVAVGAGGRIAWAEGFGYADLETRATVTPDTLFRVGDASVTLTSAAVGLLLETRRLNLDHDIQEYVPEFPDKQWSVTLRQLMAHVAGVRDDAGDEEPISQHCEKTLDGLRRFAARPLLFEPDTRFRRSSYGWILVSAAVEAAAKTPFSAFMRTQIFDPLGMAATTAESASESIPDRATFYFPRFAGDPRYGPELVRQGDYSCFSGANGFLSTPSDLVRFGMAVSQGRLLHAETVETLLAPQRLASGDETGYGLGWKIQAVEVNSKPIRAAGYSSKRNFIGGAASFLVLPEQGIVVAVMSNESFADTASLATKIAQVFAVLSEA